jgi:hypothetical protein
MLKAWTYRVASNETSIYNSKTLSKYTWFNFKLNTSASLIDLFVDDFVNGLAKLNGASLTYEYHGKVILSATLKYVTSMQIEIKTPSFTIVVPDDVDEMKTKLRDVMHSDDRTKHNADIDAFIESLR